MLTATQTSGYEYKGDLCVYGTGNDIPFADEAVTFALEPFDKKGYRDLGGFLLGSFDAYGLIHTSAGDYFVLLDGDRPLIEPRNSGITFYGSLLPAEQAVEAQHIADESKRLMRTLHDGCDKTNQNTTGYSQGKPTWYPDWLMPKPLTSAEDWMWLVSSNALGYNPYMTRYQESGAYFDDVLEYYQNQLSGYENYEAFVMEGNATAVIYFTKGAYSLQIILSGSSSTEVIVYIT